MKKLTLLLSFFTAFISCSDIHLQTPSPLQPLLNQPNNTITLSFLDLIELIAACNQSDRPIIIQNNNSPVNTTNVFTNIQQEFSTVMNSVQTMIQKTDTVADNLITYLYNYVTTHKYEVLGATVCGLYIYAFYQSVRMRFFLRDENCWHNWRKELSFHELCTMTMAQLSQSLMHVIQSRYINPQNPTDHITPLAQFLTAITKEIKSIEQYIRLAIWIISFKLHILLPIGRKTLAVAQEKLRRLYFIKHIFTQSVASQNAACVS